MREAIEEVGTSKVVRVEGVYKHIVWTPCCVHALNNTLNDIGKVDWVKQMH